MRVCRHANFMVPMLNLALLITYYHRSRSSPLSLPYLFISDVYNSGHIMASHPAAKRPKENPRQTLKRKIEELNISKYKDPSDLFNDSAWLDSMKAKIKAGIGMVGSDDLEDAFQENLIATLNAMMMSLIAR